MNESIRKILEAAILAPSGDNCQPWRFVVRNQNIDLYNVPENDKSLYNKQQRASYVAHGALLENLTLAAASAGWRTSITLFPDGHESTLVAQIHMDSDCRPDADPLVAAIGARATNRSRFNGGRLTLEQSRALLACNNNFKDTRILLSEKLEEKQNVAAMASRNDWLVFANQPLHQFLFEQIRWTQQEAERSRDGLDVETMGLSRADRLGFPNLRYWPLVNTLNRFGLSRMIGSKAQRLCCAAAALGAVIVPGATPEHYLQGGRVMQRVWLQATALGYQFQPYAGVAFLMQTVNEGGGTELTPYSRSMLRHLYVSMQERYSLGNGVVVLFFRLGKGGAPTRRSLRRKLDDLVSCR